MKIVNDINDFSFLFIRNCVQFHVNCILFETQPVFFLDKLPMDLNVVLTPKN